MPLSNDPEKRARQLENLAAGRRAAAERLISAAVERSEGEPRSEPADSAERSEGEPRSEPAGRVKPGRLQHPPAPARAARSAAAPPAAAGETTGEPQTEGGPGKPRRSAELEQQQPRKRGGFLDGASLRDLL